MVFNHFLLLRFYLEVVGICRNNYIKRSLTIGICWLYVGASWRVNLENQSGSEITGYIKAFSFSHWLFTMFLSQRGNNYMRIVYVHGFKIDWFVEIKDGVKMWSIMTSSSIHCVILFSRFILCIY